MRSSSAEEYGGALQQRLQSVVLGLFSSTELTLGKFLLSMLGFEDASEIDPDRYILLRRARRRIKASYSLPTRRRNSRHKTRQMVPMQDPANMPCEVMCQELERKPGSLD